MDPDQRLLRQARVGTDGASLVEFLRKVSPADVPPERIEQFIRKLGSQSFVERDQAAKELVAGGMQALPALRQALKSSDPEVVRRAQSCIRGIVPSDRVQGLPPAAVRLLVRLRPVGAVEALLRYVPNAADESLEEELWYGLDTLTLNEGKVDPALVEALKNVVPVRRAVAAYIVGRRGNPEQRAEVRKLFADSDPLVRLRAAQGLLAAKDKSAIPVLVALLDLPSVPLAWQAEELLHWVAGDAAPEATVGSGSAQRRQHCRQAWQAWWRERGPKVDLVQLDQELRRPGLLLMRAEGGPTIKSRVWLCGCDGKPRWQYDSPHRVTDAQLLPDDRLLIAEWPFRRVGQESPPRIEEGPTVGLTERDLDGRIVWQYTSARFPMACRRLPNGNTFIVERSCHVAEVTPDGELSFTRNLSVGLAGPTDPQKLSNGHILCGIGRLNQLEFLVEVEPTTVDYLKRIQIQDKIAKDCHVEPLPNGHYLIAARADQRVVEVDGTGKTVWQYTAPTWDALRLQNGSTLISCGRGGEGNRVIEVDPDGKIVWEIFLDGLTWLRPCLGLVRLGFDTPRPAGLDIPSSMRSRLIGLADKDPTVRRLSVYALQALGPKAREALPALIDALDDSDEIVRKRAEEAIVKVMDPKDLPALLRAAKDRRVKVRLGITSVLGNLRDQPKAVVPTLLEAVHDGNNLVRRKAVSVLYQFGSEKEVVPALVEALKDKDVRTNQAELSVAQLAASNLGTLARLGRDDKAAVPPLIDAIKTGDSHLRDSALRALGEIGARNKGLAPALVPTLLEALRDKQDFPNRATAAFALGLIGAEAKDAIPELLEGLKLKGVQDSQIAEAIRANVLWALSQFGAVAAPAITTILQDDKMDPKTRQRAAKTLGEMGPAARSSVPALTAALKLDDPLLRAVAAFALGLIGAEAKDAIPDLVEALKLKDVEDSQTADAIRANVLRTLTQFGAVAVPAITSILQDEKMDPKSRQRAAQALGDMSLAARSSVPALTRALKADDPLLRAEADRALKKLMP